MTAIPTPEIILDYLERSERQKVAWLVPPKGRPHPRPAHEIERQREDLEIIRFMISRYKGRR